MRRDACAAPGRGRHVRSPADSRFSHADSRFSHADIRFAYAPLRFRHAPRIQARSARGVPSRPDPAETGSATVLAVGVVLAIVTMLLGALAVASAVATAHRAAAAADLAALSGASALGRGAGAAAACAAAARVAGANGASLASCDVLGEEVTVRATVGTAWAGLPNATARARAGPPARA